jgi:hypothetical protein
MADDEDIDDSMSANPEPARADLGYQVTTEPRSRRPRGDQAGRWEIVFREGVSADPASPVARTCRLCGPVPAGTILHSLGDDIRRNVCGPCVGKENRRRYCSGGGGPY